jgi:large subunit ribosomal protein L11
MGFCKEFNAKTQDKAGNVLPVVITVYADKSFTFELKQPPVAEMIKKAAGVEKGSGVPNRDKVGKITKEQVRSIAKAKKPDLRCKNEEAAMLLVAGTARSMGVDVLAE